MKSRLVSLFAGLLMAAVAVLGTALSPRMGRRRQVSSA